MNGRVDWVDGISHNTEDDKCAIDGIMVSQLHLIWLRYLHCLSGWSTCMFLGLLLEDCNIELLLLNIKFKELTLVTKGHSHTAVGVLLR